MKIKVMLIVMFLGSVFNLKAQKNRAVLYLRSGDTIKGLAKITVDNKILYRKDKKSKRETHDHQTLKKVKINVKGTRKEFEYKLVKTKKYAKPKLMTPITLGKINLYKIDVTIMSNAIVGGPQINNTIGGGFGLGVNNFNDFSINNYYVGKGDTDFVEKLTSSNNRLFEKSFKKAASEYFKDCSKLVEMIQSKEFRKRDLEEIVEFYNEDCD